MAASNGTNALFVELQVTLQPAQLTTRALNQAALPQQPPQPRSARLEQTSAPLWTRCQTPTPQPRPVQQPGRKQWKQ